MTHNLKRILATAGLGLGLLGAALLTSPTQPAYAKAKSKSKAANAAVDLKRSITLTPEGLRWGISLAMVSKVYENYFDNLYVPLYKKADPGPQTNMLDAELAEKKDLIRRHRLEFGTTPTGLDQTPLKDEYSYNNGESISKITLAGGTVRYYFFFSDRLWKVYDEYKLGPGSKLGSNWEGAIDTLSEMFGAKPAMLEPDPAHGRAFQEGLWLADDTYIRVIDRSYQDIVAIAWCEKSVQDNLASRRPNKLPNATAMDRSVRDVTRPDPNIKPLPTGPSSDTKK